MVRFEICGHVGAAPAAIAANAATPSCRFPVAHTFPAFVTERGQQVPEQTTWLQITAWGKQATAVLQHVNKGDKVYVEGVIRTREIKQADGTSKYYTDYEARVIEFMSKAPAQTQPQTSAAQTQPQASAAQTPAAPSAATSPQISPAGTQTQVDFPFPPPAPNFDNW